MSSITENEHHIMLNSISNLDMHKHNTIAKFKTTLHTPLILDGEWKCGMWSATFPNRFVSVKNGDEGVIELQCYKYGRDIHRNVLVDQPLLQFIIHFYLPSPGSYQDPDELINTLHELSSDDPQNKLPAGKKKLGDYVEFSYSKALNKFIMTDKQLEGSPELVAADAEWDIKAIVFQQGLGDQMGVDIDPQITLWPGSFPPEAKPGYQGKRMEFIRLFPRDWWQYPKLRVFARIIGILHKQQLISRPFERRALMEQYGIIFLETDFIHPSNRGNKQAFQLAHLPVDLSQPYQTVEPKRVVYKKVRVNNLPEIELKFTDLNSNLVEFMDDSRETHVHLHFVRVK